MFLCEQRVDGPVLMHRTIFNAGLLLQLEAGMFSVEFRIRSCEGLLSFLPGPFSKDGKLLSPGLNVEKKNSVNNE